MSNQSLETPLGPPLLTTRDVQSYTRLSRPTVIRLHDSGALPAVEVLKRNRKRLLRWRPETVQQFIEEREKRHA